jgi:UV DNA damage repair endonuclease
MVTKRVGFACKWIDTPEQVNGVGPKDDAKQYNTGTTTIAWLKRQTQDKAEEKLWNLMVQNLESTRKLVSRVGDLDEALRMVRISSDLLPAYTEHNWSYFWRRPDVVKYLEHHFSIIGDIARDRDVRLSFHPGQFCVLASDSNDIVDRSIEEFEYHTDMARYMGYGKKFQDLKINVHIAGRKGPQGIRDVHGRLSPEARNCITIENEEYTHGLDECLQIADIVPIVLDVHHHWVREGEYIQPDDPRVAKVINSWRGVRPTLHYSVSKESLLEADYGPGGAPFMESLLKKGFKKNALRAHSNFYWNHTLNRWVFRFWPNFDIMCESKGKNLAAHQLHHWIMHEA